MASRKRALGHLQRYCSHGLVRGSQPTAQRGENSLRPCPHFSCESFGGQKRLLAYQHHIGDDRVASNVAKGLAFVLVGAGCWAVLPTIGKSSIGHAVGLLGANDKFLIKSGLSRLRFLARSDEYALCIIENGGTSKLISLLQKNTEKELLMMALEVLDNLAEFDSSRWQLKKAGLETILHEGLVEGWIQGGELSTPAQNILLKLKKKNEHTKK